MFKETHPILGTRDIQRAIEFYTQQLGFKLDYVESESGAPTEIALVGTAADCVARARGSRIEG
jgi:catechol 2,3-dioxygenase-like lactoylglutathione lyase family enzyme